MRRGTGMSPAVAGWSSRQVRECLRRLGRALTMMPPHIASACCSPMTAATEIDSFSSTGKNWGPGAASLRHHGQYGCMTSNFVTTSISPTNSKHDSACQ